MRSQSLHTCVSDKVIWLAKPRRRSSPQSTALESTIRDRLCRWLHSLILLRPPNSLSAVLRLPLQTICALTIHAWSSDCTLGLLSRSNSNVSHFFRHQANLSSHFCRVLSTKDVRYHQFPYVAMILIEPMMVTSEIFTAQPDERMAHMEFVVDATSARRDTWRSKE